MNDSFTFFTLKVGSHHIRSHGCDHILVVTNTFGEQIVDISLIKFIRNGLVRWNFSAQNCRLWTKAKKNSKCIGKRMGALPRLIDLHGTVMNLAALSAVGDVTPATCTWHARSAPASLLINYTLFLIIDITLFNLLMFGEVPISTYW